MLVAIIALCGLSAAAPATWPPAGFEPPALLFGPTANHPAVADETLALLEGAQGAWGEVRGRLIESGGALHIRSRFGDSEESQRRLAKALKDLGLDLSVEDGESGFCGVGSGANLARQNLKKLEAYFAAGGTVKYWEITSSFSRTHRGCPKQDLNTTLAEAAAYGAAIQTARPEAMLFLYEALPHYAVGSAFPANDPSYGLELGYVLAALRERLAAKGVILHGYWADCPQEYSTSYPKGDGYKRLAAAADLVASMGLAFGKTFNSQQGGATSNEAFYRGTLADFDAAAAVLPTAGGAPLSYAMVETWYAYPTVAGPEGTAYTTANAARDLFRRIREV